MVKNQAKCIVSGDEYDKKFHRYLPPARTPSASTPSAFATWEGGRRSAMPTSTTSTCPARTMSQRASSSDGSFADARRDCFLGALLYLRYSNMVVSRDTDVLLSSRTKRPCLLFVPSRHNPPTLPEFCCCLLVSTGKASNP